MSKRNGHKARAQRLLLAETLPAPRRVVQDAGALAKKVFFFPRPSGSILHTHM